MKDHRYTLTLPPALPDPVILSKVFAADNTGAGPDLVEANTLIARACPIHSIPAHGGADAPAASLRCGAPARGYRTAYRQIPKAEPQRARSGIVTNGGIVLAGDVRRTQGIVSRNGVCPLAPAYPRGPRMGILRSLADPDDTDPDVSRMLDEAVAGTSREGLVVAEELETRGLGERSRTIALANEKRRGDNRQPASPVAG